MDTKTIKNETLNYSTYSIEEMKNETEKLKLSIEKWFSNQKAFNEETREKIELIKNAIAELKRGGNVEIPDIEEGCF